MNSATVFACNAEDRWKETAARVFYSEDGKIIYTGQEGTNVDLDRDVGVVDKQRLKRIRLRTEPSRCASLSINVTLSVTDCDKLCNFAEGPPTLTDCLVLSTDAAP